MGRKLLDTLELMVWVKSFPEGDTACSGCQAVCFDKELGAQESQGSSHGQDSLHGGVGDSSPVWYRVCATLRACNWPREFFFFFPPRGEPEEASALLRLSDASLPLFLKDESFGPLASEICTAILNVGATRLAEARSQ